MNRRSFVISGMVAATTLALAPGVTATKPVPSAPTPNQTAIASLPSAGMGATGQQWVAVYGKPYDDKVNGRQVYHYPDKGYDVWLMDYARDQPSLFFNLQFSKPVAPDYAVLVAAVYVPTDAVQLATTPLDDGSVSVLWHSDWLATVVDDPSLWINANPGDFLCVYQQDQGKIGAVLFGPGNAP